MSDIDDCNNCEHGPRAPFVLCSAHPDCNDDPRVKYQHWTPRKRAPSAPSEKDALEDLDAMKRRLMDEPDAMDEVTTHRWWWRYSQNVDSRLRALLSRLAEPAASTATARAEAIAAHGYLANPDDVGRVAHLLEQMEPAQAASSEDSPAISSVTLRASIAVEHETERRIAAEERAARAEAALASERVKREGEPCAHCGPPAWEGYRPAPDAAALREALSEEADQLERWANESRLEGWSTHQVDPMRQRAEQLRALLRSEPRGEEGR